MTTLSGLKSQLDSAKATLSSAAAKFTTENSQLSTDAASLANAQAALRNATARGQTESLTALSATSKSLESSLASQREVTTQAAAEQSVAKQALNVAQSNFNNSSDLTTTVKDTAGTTNASASSLATSVKYKDPQNIQDTSNSQSVTDYLNSFSNTDQKNAVNAQTTSILSQSNESTPELARLARSKLPFGAQAKPPAPAAPVIVNKNQDTRANLKIPSSYITQALSSLPNSGSAVGSSKLKSFKQSNAIVFPFTPTVNQDYKASYTAHQPVHSNYSLYFFKTSAPGPISLSAKFAVQDEDDAGYLITVIHLLRSLTKMKFGTDTDAGSPPPVCRLNAYGSYMFDNTPVVLDSFRIEFPDAYDYYTSNYWYPGTSVPTIITFSIALLPVYSRREMSSSSVKTWLDGTDRKGGLL